MRKGSERKSAVILPPLGVPSEVFAKTSYTVCVVILGSVTVVSMGRRLAQKLLTNHISAGSRPVVVLPLTVVLGVILSNTKI